MVELPAKASFPARAVVDFPSGRFELGKAPRGTRQFRAEAIFAVQQASQLPVPALSQVRRIRVPFQKTGDGPVGGVKQVAEASDKNPLPIAFDYPLRAALCRFVPRHVKPPLDLSSTIVRGRRDSNR